jgi:hypothetical protein
LIRNLYPSIHRFGVFGGQSAVLPGLSTEMGCFGGQIDVFAGYFQGMWDLGGKTLYL